jgi:hypothetical protein
LWCYLSFNKIFNVIDFTVDFHLFFSIQNVYILV